MIQSKLTEKDKEKIKQLREEGCSVSALAARYSVSRVTIYRVLDPAYMERTRESSREYKKINAQKVAAQVKEAARRYNLTFFRESEPELIEFLDSKENLHDYIRDLVKKDLRGEINWESSKSEENLQEDKA